MEQPPPAGAPQSAAADPVPNVEVTCTQQEDTAHIRVVGELTDHARRPLVRIMTDLMLSGTTLHRVVVDTRRVTFFNSAGIAVLVQLQKMAHPRGIEMALEVQGSTVLRPLQLSGLWNRFTIIDERTDSGSG
jgi:anti-anti-sigma factor